MGPVTPYVAAASSASTPAMRPQPTIRTNGVESTGVAAHGDRDRRMTEMENTLTQVVNIVRGQSYANSAFHTNARIEPPIRFDGNRARTWLRQIEQFAAQPPATGTRVGF